MKKVFTKNAPEAVGPYSQAVISNGLIFCSGQIGIDPLTGKFAGDTIESQTEQIFKNLSAVLEEAGSSLESVVKTTCYIKNINNFPKFNERYANFMTQKPARATIEVSDLPKNALVEVEAIASI
jgi:2-iminobutanoate/2-iminopropanoate deaminase